jgi:hypothetical protein
LPSASRISRIGVAFGARPESVGLRSRDVDLLVAAASGTVVVKTKLKTVAIATRDLAERLM